MKKTVRIFISLALLLMINVFGGFAQEVGTKFKYSDGLYYRVTSLNPQTVELAPQTDVTKLVGGITINSEVFYEGKTYNVTKIASQALLGCAGLTSITIPESVTTIGDTAFGMCSSLTSVVLPSGITSIEDFAFGMCSSLTSIIIKVEDVQAVKMGNLVFNGVNYANCTLKVPSNKVGNYKTAEQWKSFTKIEEISTEISNQAKVGDKFEVGGLHYMITSLNPQAVEVISPNEGVSYSEEANQPEGEIVIPSKVVCEGNTYKVTSIKESIFQYCEKITSVKILDGITSIGEYAFEGCNGITTLVLPGTLVQIGESAFSYCEALTSVTIPGSVVSIGAGAFSNCSNLTSAVLSAGMKSIGENAFQACRQLKTLTLPVSVSSIGSSAFSDCSSLAIINSFIDNINNVAIGENIFAGVDKTSCTIKVPSDKIEAYKMADQWKEFAKIEEFISNVPDKVGDRFESAGVYYLITSLTPRVVQVVAQNNDYPYWEEDNQPTGELVIPTEVSHDGNKYSVKSIKEGTYQYCEDLTSVQIQDGLMQIGNYAFEGCSNLETVSFPNTLVGIGEGAFTYCGKISILTIPASVTAIETGAFSYCSELTSLTISDGVKSIGENAFAECLNLSALNIPGSVTSVGEKAFFGCSGITSVKIHNGVTSIDAFAFEDCNKLKTFDIPESVSSIGRDAFSKCSALNTINVDEKNTHYTSEDGILFDKAKTELVRYPLAKNGNYTIPNTVTTVAKYAFADCQSLTSVVIPNGVTAIGAKAFAGCNGLVSLTSFVEDVTTITLGGKAFQGIDFSKCTLKVPVGKKEEYQIAEGWKNFSSIEEVEVVVEDKLGDKIQDEKGISYIITSLSPRTVQVAPENQVEGDLIIPEEVVHNTNKYSVTSIGANAFWICKKLTSVVIPATVTEIKDEAFAQSPKLLSVTIPSSVKSISGGAFIGCSSLASVVLPAGIKAIESGTFNGCTSLVSVTIPNSVTSIKLGAFLGCTSLASVTLPEKLDIIGNYAFAECTSLKSIIIPNKVSSIGDYVFSKCSGLTSVTLPEKLVSIGDYAFSMCNNLASVSFPNTLRSIGVGAFAECSSLTIVTLPSKVKTIKEGVFGFCDNLTAINVETDNLAYSSVDGILFNKEETELVQYPAGKEGKYIVLDDLKTIGKWSFAGSEKLTEVVISEGVTLIETSAFYACKGLSSITLPSSIKVIRKDAFYECSGLNNIISHIENINDVIINGNVFYDVDKEKCILKVPATKLDDYKIAQYWKDFKNIIANDGTGVENHTVLTNPVSVVGNNITVSEVEGKQVSLHNVLGRLIYNTRSAQGNVSITTPSKGIYILRVGNGVAKIMVH